VILKWSLGDSSHDPDERHHFKALIDTGASSTCVSEEVVGKCGLDATGMVPMIGATGEADVEQFTFAVGFVFPHDQEPSGQTNANLIVRPVQGLKFHNGKSTSDVLLGRDIICDWVFSLSFDGRYIISI